MKRCKYCGRENDDQAAHCGDCGSSDFKPLAPVKMPEPGRAVHPGPETPAARLAVEKGLRITRITCRTAQEADLVIRELESAEIIGIVADEVVEEARGTNIGDRPIPVLTSTKAYEAARELHAVIDPTVIANTPLPWATRCLIMFLPILTCLGVVMFWDLLSNFEHHGQERRAREARLWFARGLALWVLGGLLVWAARAVLR